MAELLDLSICSSIPKQSLNNIKQVVPIILLVFGEKRTVLDYYLWLMEDPAFDYTGVVVPQLFIWQIRYWCSQDVVLMFHQFHLYH